MGTYSVIAPDGQTYGPADEVALAQWAREGRINAQTTLQNNATGERLTPHMLPSLAQAIGLPQNMVSSLVQQNGQPVPVAPLPYGHPAGYAAVNPAAHLLDSFSVPAVVLLHFVTFGIFTLIWFNLMHGKMPRLRHNDPSAGKAIGFCFIPFFNLYWFFFTYLRLIDRVNEQRRFAGLPETAPRGMCIAAGVCIFIPLANYISFLILLPVFFGMMQSSVNELVRATRGASA